MRYISSSLSLAIILIAVSCVTFGQNYKLKQTTTISGQAMTSTVYVKGSRKRTESTGFMGMGFDVATVDQCDMKRTVQINDKKKLYFIDPYATEDSRTPPSGRVMTPPPGGPTTGGGTITIISSVVDTGERKDMYGLKARHLKTTMSMESSPDACNKGDMRIETDGWYVDLPQFSCPMAIPSNPMGNGGSSRPGCTDRMVFKQNGSAQLGFPLQFTQTMRSGDGSGTVFTQSTNTTEFSTATLDDALFNIPPGYSLANSSKDVYGKPDYSKGKRDEQDGSDVSQTDAGVSSTPNSKRPGTIRIGVLLPTNHAGDNIPPSNMQSYLLQKLTDGNVDAVAVNSETEARGASCDYLLSSDFVRLRQSTAGKIGGVFGKITNSDTAGKFDAEIDFSLVKLSSGQAVLTSKAAAKTETDMVSASQGVLAQEAGAVLSAAQR